jgi:DNA helicase-2/ATP-dependent DNA helicase PcrA
MSKSETQKTTQPALPAPQSFTRHPDWPQEEQHLDQTLTLVASPLEESRATKRSIDSEVHRLMETGDPDSSIDYADLSVNLMIQGSLELRLRNLAEASRKPYFARVDFREEGSAHVAPYYIGKMVLIRESDMKPVIIDWRAPVASLYYEERLGEAHYQAPRGDVRGTMSLKRQYTIEDGRLQNLFDIDITTNDTFLQSFLGANADTRLKDIVSTIQAEQNRIIRADMWTPLIVQGAAGSGKTTIALHRIAYLVYTHEKFFKPEAFMIIAPNTLFLNYISEILPELGVDRVRQTTFEDFAMDLIGRRFRIRDPMRN